MRKVLLILACMVVLLSMVMLALLPSAASTAPDVKVTFVGFTNDGTLLVDARFQVMNRSGQSIRVSEVGIQNCEPFDSWSVPGTIPAKPGRVEAGILREFRTPFTPLARRWRGAIELSRESPDQRFRDWLLRQPRQWHLPRKWIEKTAVIYIFHSQWVEPDPLIL